MAIKPVVSNIYAGRNLVPKSAHKGPILKLTPKEQATIREFETKISELEIEKTNLLSYIQRTKFTNGLEDFYYEKLETLNYWIDNLRNSIHNIKVERYNKQKEKFINK